jgi:3-hydroxybutyryl-CoA dehydrogenase
VSDGPAVGVIGAGTMGRGIAQVAALAGWRAAVVDTVPAALHAAPARVCAELDHGTSRGRWGADAAAGALEAISFGGALDALAGCELVVEAVPERLELKRDVLAAAEAAIDQRAILATNTSSLSVAALATALRRPERFIGMHFFNPAAIVRLVEVIPVQRTAPEVLERVHAVAQAWGKTTVTASDTPGFIVNRCARPMYAEPDQLLHEDVAEPAQIDEIVRAGGFRMGPFELIDLIGVDVNLDVQRSLWEQSYGEPRWRPARRQTMLVAAGRLGRKTGEGFHRYPPGPAAGAVGRPTANQAPGPVAVHGQTRLATQLRSRFDAHGLQVVDGDDAAIHVDAVLDRPPARDGLALVLCWSSSLALARRPGAVGFSVVPPLDAEPAVELVAGDAAPDHVRRARELFAAAGLASTIVGDGPGLVLARLVAQLVNEAWFAVQEGVAAEDDVDAAMTLALSHPRGPIAWGRAMGLDGVLAVLDGAHAEIGDDRYRAAVHLRRAAIATADGSHA